MKLDILQSENAVTVYIEGRLDTVTSPELEKMLAPYFAVPEVTLVMDCESMEYISSAGLRVVLVAHKSINAKGGKLVLKNLKKEVLSVFDITGFSRILTIE